MSDTRTTQHAQTAQAAAHEQPAFSLKISTAKNGAPLSKAQKTFNRLIAQIENLRSKIARERRRLDDTLQYHAQKLHPLKRQIAAGCKRIVVFAHTHLKTSRSSFSHKQRHALREFISMQLRTIIAVEGDLADEKLQAIFADIEGITLREARRREREAERAKIEDDMADFGMDIDLSAFHDEMTPEEFVRAQADVMEQFKKAGLNENDIPPEFRHIYPGNATRDPDTANPGPKPRKKTKKQLDREAREKAVEEARTRSLSGIYKQLARVFHPDLEQNPALKKQKVALMQQLTAAYRANDMHTLLRLELEWLQRGEHDAERLSEEKLAIYNEVLREQVGALQEEQHTLSHDPRYESLRPYATGILGGISHINVVEEEKKLKRTLETLHAIDTNATGIGAIKKLKAVLRDFAQEAAGFAREREIDDIMEDAINEVMSAWRDGRSTRW